MVESEEPLTQDEKALLDSRIAAYLEDPQEGSSWEELENRIRARLTRKPNHEQDKRGGYLLKVNERTREKYS